MVKESEYYKKLGEKIYSSRKEKSMTQEQLSYKSDVERSKISRIENGNEDFHFSTLIKLIDALELKPKDLFDF